MAATASVDHECRRLRRPARPSRSATATRCSRRVERDVARRDRRPRQDACRRGRGRRGRDIDVYTVGVVTCRPTAREAAGLLRAHLDRRQRRLGAPSTTSWRCARSRRKRTARSNSRRCATTRPTAWAGCRWSATPTVAQHLARLAEAGLTGIAVSFVNYLDELPYFRDEVLPRLARSELRDNRTAERIGSL